MPSLFARVAALALRLCAVLQLVFGLAACVVAAVLYEQRSSEVSRRALQSASEAVRNGPWFPAVLFAAGAQACTTAGVGLVAAAPRRPRLLYTYLVLLTLQLLPQVVAAAALHTDPTLGARLPHDATGGVSRLRRAVLAQPAVFQAAAAVAFLAQVLALGLASGLLPNSRRRSSDADAAEWAAEDAAALATREAASAAAWRDRERGRAYGSPQQADLPRWARSPGQEPLRSPLLLPEDAPPRGQDPWSVRMRARYGFETGALTYDPRLSPGALPPVARSPSRCSVM